MTSWRSVVKYPVGASGEERELCLLVGLKNLIHELIVELGTDPQRVEDRAYRAIEDAVDWLEAEAE